MANRRALSGHEYICGACGKRSHDKYGFHPISTGWDESCMMHAVLCKTVGGMHEAVDEMENSVAIKIKTSTD